MGSQPGVFRASQHERTRVVVLFAVVACGWPAHAQPPDGEAPPEAVEALPEPPSEPTVPPVPTASPEPTPALHCVPTCRVGFTCVDGRCVSACDPACAPGQTCSSEARCEALATPEAAVLSDDAEPKYSWIGLQAAGSAYFQLVVRLRLAGPLQLELGAFVLPLGGLAGNASTGLLLEIASIQTSPSFALRPYMATGVGAGGACGDDGDDTDGVSCRGAAFASARAGLAFVVLTGHGRELLLALDGGVWHGIEGEEGERNRSFTWPMVGVGGYMSL